VIREIPVLARAKPSIVCSEAGKQIAFNDEQLVSAVASILVVSNQIQISMNKVWHRNRNSLDSEFQLMQEDRLTLMTSSHKVHFCQFESVSIQSQM
jgi:hypothetical protein